jgi:hypothetical protein
MTWQQGGPAGITFQVAAVVMVVRERGRPEQKRPATAKSAGQECGSALMLLTEAVQASAVQI